MNDIEERVTILLRGAADRVRVRPDRRAVVDATTARPRLIERPRHHGTAFACSRCRRLRS